MRKDRKSPSGQIHRLLIESAVLKGNRLGDPSERVVDVYVPHGHDSRGLSLLVDIVGFTAGGPAHTNWKNFGENVPERLDRLIANGAMPPVVVAFPDCFTRLGGNQYINSEVMGRWADFLLEECVPMVEEKFGCGGAGRRGIFGKSSGGYGSVAHALLYPDFWAAAACHSGDMAFELCYLPEFPRLLRAFAKCDGSIEKWLDKFHSAPKVNDSEVHDLMTLAMCATYDFDPHGYLGIRIPVDRKTCELNEEHWAHWLKWDPCVMVETRGEGLRKLKALWIDCGDIDQYNLVYGARRLHRALEKFAIQHTYEEFSDNHSSVDYRMDRSLPFLAKALS